MALDLSKFNQIPGEWSWGNEAIKRLGSEDTFYTIRNAMFKTLSDIPEGKYFDIEKSVKPENHEMFIKVTCEFMQYESFKNYRFNRLMNRVYHDFPLKLSIKPDEN